MTRHNLITVAQFVHQHLAHRPRIDLPGIGCLNTVDRAKRFVRACDANFITGGTQPFYDPDADVIVMPSLTFYLIARIYTPATKYALILLHELTHWTGHGRRIGRRRHHQPFDPIYAREELIAELGSALLCHDLAITSRPTLPHTRYLNGFLAALPNPAIDLAVALSHANQAVGYLTSVARRRLTLG